MADLLRIAATHGLVLPHNVRAVKKHVVAHILEHAPADAVAAYNAEVEENTRERLLKSIRSPRKRARQDAGESSVTRPSKRLRTLTRGEEPAAQVADDNSAVVADDTADGVVNPTHPQYLQLPTMEERKQCHIAFLDSISDEALLNWVCGVCARERDHVDPTCNMMVIDLGNIPNKDRLRPVTAHPKHTLYEGLLLDPAGVKVTSTGTEVVVCDECRHSLNHATNLPPMFSLANDMWIGDIPEIIQQLTIPEQLLLALVVPRVFVFKLRPKAWMPNDLDTLQRGMKGNVSSYEMDQDGITAMLEGEMLPRPITQLASILTVTYVGPGTLPKDWIHRTFRVRRAIVRAAFLSMQETYPSKFGHLVLSEARLSQLPDDAVPVELLACIRQETDMGMLDEEHGGYVPSADTALSTEGKRLRNGFCTGTLTGVTHRRR
ncbi:hypothetical protein K523DRAFT_398787 [Schizophyllum commune Tattone D]|nr:hypothetical protein K523DRAFT_398787 [Schizophyllum commune Tattone D]